MIFGHSPSAKPISVPHSFASNGKPISATTVPAGQRELPGNNGAGDGGVASAVELNYGSNNTGRGRYFGTLNPNVATTSAVLCDGDDTFTQTAFLGASIMDFSVTLGYGEQSSSLTVKLVEDLCEGHSRIYYHGHADLKVGNFSTLRAATRTTADYFLPPAPGSPVYFRMGRFEFSGLLQSWTKTNSTGGYPTYTVNIQDPRELLAGVSLIIGEETTIPSISNIYNVFGTMEQYGNACAVSPVGGFGGANVNGEGMPWNKILTGLHLLQAQGKYISFAGATYVLDLTDLPAVPDDFRIGGATVTLSDAISKVCEDSGRDYFVDLIPTPLSQGGFTPLFYSNVLNILKIRTIDRTAVPSLNTIAAFVETTDNLVMESSRGRELRNEITNAMIIGASKQDIYECECATSISEDRDGGRASEWLDGIIPFWGAKRPDSHEIILTRKKKPVHGAAGDPKIMGIWAPFEDVQFQLEKKLLEDGSRLRRDPVDGETLVYDLDEDELRAALSSQQDWQFWITSQKDHPVNRTYFPKRDKAGNIIVPRRGNVGGMSNGVFNGFWDLFEAILGGTGTPNPADLMEFNSNVSKLASEKISTGQEQRDLDKIFRWVQTYANRYGREWLVPLYGNLCWQLDTDDPYKKKYSVEPIDSGWPESSGSEVIGLSLPIARIISGDETGKVAPFLRFLIKSKDSDFEPSMAGAGLAGGTKTDFTELSPEEYYISESALSGWVKASVDKNIYFLKEAWGTEDYGPHALLQMSASIKELQDTAAGGTYNSALAGFKKIFEELVNDPVGPGGNSLRAMFPGRVDDLFKAIMNEPNSRMLNFGMEHSTLSPAAGAVPLLNNILNYGPWQSSPPGADGKTATEVIDGLAPWEYGGFDLMNTAGQNLANQRVTHMQQGEMGSIKVPGLPNNVRVGFELNDIGGSKALIATDRSMSSAVLIGEGTLEDTNQSYYYVAAGGLDGAGGPNITAINVSVGAGGVTTQYDFKTYTPEYGKFSKFNAERLKRMGKARINAERERIKRSDHVLSAFGSKRAATLIRGVGRRARGVPQPRRAAASPHPFFIGTVSDWSAPNLKNIKYARVITESFHEGTTELDENYGQKAIMDLAGLIRPVSMAGDGNLPQYYSSQNLVDDPPCTNSQHITSRPTPPINGYNAPEGLAQGDFDININYLNPFTNPSNKQKSAKHISDEDESTAKEHGHDIAMIARGETPTDGHFSISMQEWNEGEDKDEVAYADDYRMFALRGPLLIHGWGYDLQGKPIPNEADPEADAAEGKFKETDLKDYFLPNFLRKSHTWPVAPVDLRFDRNRGVWTVPPPPAFVLLEFTEAVSPNSTNEKAKIIDAADSSSSPGFPAIYGKDGSVISSDKFVKFEEDAGVRFEEGMKTRAYYDENACVYKSFGSPDDYVPAASEADCNGLVIGTIYGKMMKADEHGEATLDEAFGGEVVTVINILNQPILEGSKVILWKRCESPETEEGECSEGTETCGGDPDGEPCEEDADCSTTTQSIQYHVVQAQFRPMCVVTSIGIDENYPYTPPANVASVEITNKKIITSVYVDDFSEGMHCWGPSGPPFEAPCGHGINDATKGNCECKVTVDDLTDCSDHSYYSNVIPPGAIQTCFTDLENEGEFNHRHQLGSFALVAQSDFDFDAYVAVDHPSYPVLHIDICERTIYLESAWSNAYCSDERSESAGLSVYAGDNQWGKGVPVYGEALDVAIDDSFDETTCHEGDSNDSTGLAEGGLIDIVGFHEDVNVPAEIAVDDCGGCTGDQTCIDGECVD